MKTQNMVGFDVEKLRGDFPALRQQIHGKPLIYLDSAASTLKPQCVVSAVENFASTTYSNIHRGVYWLSQESTRLYEGARTIVRDFLGAASEKEIIFTRGATEAINLVASSWGEQYISEGDEILISAMEHHANIVPWQILCKKKNAKLNIIPITHSGEIIIEEYRKLLTSKTKMVAIAHVSNSLGTINPAEEIIRMAKNVGAAVLLDSAQAVQHIPIDVQKLQCDFLVFSGHKLYAPSGTGVLYGKKELLETMQPYQTGGDMIKKVTFAETTFADLPAKFEAGTPNIEGAIGLGEAVRYIQDIGFDNIHCHEMNLLKFGTDALMEIQGIRLFGSAANKVGVLSFALDGVHPHDIGSFLDSDGIAVRAGHHCTQPLWDFYGVSATTRISFGVYNTKEEITAAAESLRKIIAMFS